MYGTIPSSIGYLTNLQELQLFYNSFSGPIPISLTQLNSLTMLNLIGNHFTGTIPSELNKLKLLTNLLLDYNSFTGSLPSSLNTLTSLQTFSISINSFIGIIPSSYGDLSSIQYMSLFSNSFSGSVPSTLCNLYQITSLSFFATNIFCYAACLSSIPQLAAGSIPTCGNILLSIVHIFIVIYSRFVVFIQVEILRGHLHSHHNCQRLYPFTYYLAHQPKLPSLHLQLFLRLTVLFRCRSQHRHRLHHLPYKLFHFHYQLMFPQGRLAHPRPRP